jgi:hypothetical protein
MRAAVVFDSGEDPMTGLTRFAEEHNLGLMLVNP